MVFAPGVQLTILGENHAELVANTHLQCLLLDTFHAMRHCELTERSSTPEVH